jgi:RNA-directed DNA polymerase
MKASYRKGVATHPDPESCVASRKATIEALTGAHVGRGLSCEIIASGVPTSYHVTEGHTTPRQALSRANRGLRAV